jgi:small-conductance mechanosensitive channel
MTIALSGLSGADTLAELFTALARPASMGEIGLLALALALAWLMVRLTRREHSGSILFGERGFDGVLFPLLALLLTLIARWAMRHAAQAVVLKIAVPVLASLVVIRLAVRVLHVTYPDSPRVRLLERTLSWLVWGALVLWITDLLPLVLLELEDIHWRMAGVDLNARHVLEGVISASVVLVFSLWLSASIEMRLLAASGIDLSVRKIAANAVRAGLLLVGLLLAMSAVGIPLGALSVLGGAVGVGIGFGLQKLASNYVSGFVILAERSLRIGDMVKVDGFEGRIIDISTRATTIRALNGHETIVPNEMLISQRVERAALQRSKIAVLTTFQVGYDTDLAALMPQLVAAAAAVPRVLADPAPSALLSAFGVDGLELTLMFWIADPENGQGNVKSAVNLALLALLRRQGIEIPVPQRAQRIGTDVRPPAVI